MTVGAELLGKLREGTEVLRTGGGAALTAGECGRLLDVLEPPQLLRITEVAEWLAVSVPTVNRLARAGELERVHIGGSTRYRRADVEALIARGRVV